MHAWGPGHMPYTSAPPPTPTTQPPAPLTPPWQGQPLPARPPLPPPLGPQVVLEVKDEAALRKLSEALSQGGVKHKLWVEQPEDFPTCLATRPYRKSEVGQYFKKYQLSKAPVG